MRHALGLLVTCGALAACSGGPTALDDGPPDAVASIEVERGQGQRGPPVEVLPDSVVGRVLDNAGNPASGRLVNFLVPAGEEAGSFPDGDALLTNAQGRVFNTLKAGDRAWTSRVVAGEDSAYEVRLVASRDGAPDEVASFTFAVEPGDPDLGSTVRFASGSDLSGDSPLDLPLDAWAVSIRDRFDNPVIWGIEVEDSGVAHAEEAADGWGGLRTVVADAAGCARFWTRTDGGRGVAADSGLVHVTERQDGSFGVEMETTDQTC